MTISTRSALALVAGTMAEVFRPREPGETVAATPVPQPQRSSSSSRTGGAVPVYFADNSRLWPEADAKIERGRIEALCRTRGLGCTWPFEHFCFPEKFSTDMDANARALPRVPLVYLQESSAIVAEATPFRGVSLNPVIAFEMGIAVLLGLPVFAWTAANCAHQPAPSERMRRDLKGWPFTSLAARLVNGAPLTRFLTLGRGCFWDMLGFRVEHFNMVESAVIAGNFTSLSTSIDEAIECCASYFARRAEAQAAPAAGENVH